MSDTPPLSIGQLWYTLHPKEWYVRGQLVVDVTEKTVELRDVFHGDANYCHILNSDLKGDDLKKHIRAFFQCEGQRLVKEHVVFVEFIEDLVQLKEDMNK